jgi:hypothetical protein
MESRQLAELFRSITPNSNADRKPVPTLYARA